jgi:16S rRNA (cytosine967-C5)-methyltransferase
MKSRVVAALVINEVIQHGRSLNTALPSLLPKLTADDERGFTQELCYGVMRWYPRLEAIANQLLNKPLKQKDSDIYALILCGLYQLMYMRVPEHAAVGETAAMAKVLKKHWATGVINATLRNFLRNKDALLAEADETDAGRYAYPQDLLDRIRSDWPEDWLRIIEASNSRAPMTLRVNALKISRDEYLTELCGAGIEGRPFPHSASGIVLAKPMDVSKLPHFPQGWVSVQDGGAQLVPALLELSSGQRVLDACAAPGGKTCHILESMPGLAEVVALDKAPERQERVTENLARLGLHAKVLVGDAREVETWWDGELFDRILLDAPCSASGVIRRHPDIKQLRSVDDFEQLAQVQGELLRKLWPLLKARGILVYATCSICHIENERQIQRFLQDTTDAQDVKIDQNWGRAMMVGRQILPGDDGMDGFYYARLRKL